MSFSEICDWVVLIGAVTIAITNIYNFFAKPHKEAKDRKDHEIKEQIETTLDEKLPNILLEHDLETRNKYLNDRERYLNDIKAQVLEETKSTLDNILALNLKQNEAIEILTKASKDVLRQRIMNIYHQYKQEKRMPIHVREALDELYKDYKAENGNSYIDKYYNRMTPWESYDDEDSFE